MGTNEQSSPEERAGTASYEALAAKYVAQNPDTPARTIDGEAVVITPDDSRLHTLNGTATFIWDRADGTRTLEDICLEMVGAFEVESVVLITDAGDFVKEAVDKGLMLVGDAPMPLP